MSGTVVFAVPIIIAMVARVSAQSTPGATPRFEVASVKLCKDYVPLGARTGGGISSPETLDINCETLKGLIQMAYIGFATGVRVSPIRVGIEGGPKWIDSERYSIKAKAEGVSSQVMMHGPMLQALLEDRFKVKVHHETRNVPIYVLSVAKGGPKLQPFKEGTCNLYDIAAAFNFHLEYTPDETSSGGRPVAPGGAEVSGPSIFSAVQQLGLKLEPARGPADYLVVDHAEQSSEN